LAEFKKSNLRKDTPLEKWYLSERFGALPIFNESLLLSRIPQIRKIKNRELRKRIIIICEGKRI